MKLVETSFQSGKVKGFAVSGSFHDVCEKIVSSVNFENIRMSSISVTHTIPYKSYTNHRNLKQMFYSVQSNENPSL